MSVSRGQRALERGRDALERGKVRAAIRHCWDAAREGTTTGDLELLADAHRLAMAAEEAAQGKEVGEAQVLARYCGEVLAQVREGVKPQGLLGGLMSIGRDRTKRCPDCAEKIKADARVCRFCGYRYPEP